MMLLVVFMASCAQKQKVDSIIYNATIYTVDSAFSVCSALAINDGKIVAASSTNEVFKNYDSENKLNMNGKTILPGLYDAHTHFYYYALGLNEVDLTGTKSFDEVLNRLTEFAKTHTGTWIKGRGWDQNDWQIKEFPNNEKLNELFPDKAIFIQRIDGHAALVNDYALQLANAKVTTNLEGGIFETKVIKGKIELTGILIDNAVDYVSKLIPDVSTALKIKLLKQAQKNCFAVGLTSVAEAGVPKKVVDFIDSLQTAGILKMKMYLMLNPDKENFEYYLKNGPIVKDNLSVVSFKIYADGALGSRGACLLKPYSDKKNEQGFLLSNPDTLRAYAHKIAASKFQMNTHCIGDSANRFILSLYNEVLGNSIDRRWRIEHAQVIQESDFDRLSKNKIIPSVQPTHATSDMYWVYDRLGKERTKNAYAYKKMIEKVGLIAGGSDFPVEQINPFLGIYAAVSRQDSRRLPAGGFEPENKISREQAVRAFTSWAAYAGFEESKKGSLEKGKAADFIVLDKDVMHCDVYQIPSIKVLKTFSNGKKVF